MVRREDVPLHEDVRWLAAALMKAHATGCNPGGQVAAWDVTDAPNTELLDRTPRCTLMSRADLEAWGHEPVSLGDLEAEAEA